MKLKIRRNVGNVTVLGLCGAILHGAHLPEALSLVLTFMVAEQLTRLGRCPKVVR